MILVLKITLWIHLRCGNVKIFILSSKGTIMILKNIRLRYKPMTQLDIMAFPLTLLLTFIQLCNGCIPLLLLFEV